ncbi:MAG: hypothetical protein EB829_03275 [Nitrosopumilus sp. H8]|nr:MAG: hypothetical protein EB830_06400 [Nitrosopumilus sp. H13]RNJ78929.1 MAG: hypothetical protein EB829_03275 [Nitrosopumilus sp. H8]
MYLVGVPGINSVFHASPYNRQDSDHLAEKRESLGPAPLLDHKTFLDWHAIHAMLYHFELQLAGIILLTAMAAGAVSLWLKKRKELESDSAKARDDAQGSSVE